MISYENFYVASLCFSIKPREACTEFVSVSLTCTIKSTIHQKTKPVLVKTLPDKTININEQF